MESIYFMTVLVCLQFSYSTGFSLTKLHDEDLKTLDTNADLVRKLLTEILSASMNSDSPCLYENEIKSAIKTFIHQSQPETNNVAVPEVRVDSSDYPQPSGVVSKRFYSDWKRR